MDYVSHAIFTMATLEETMKIFQSCDAVCFDVDSTLIEDESIDELAAYCGVGEAVKDLTKQAMGGQMSYKETLEARLNLINPSRELMEKFIQQSPIKFTKEIPTLVSKLQERGTAIYLVTGGFTCIVRSFAEKLNIPVENIYANKLLFDYDGKYVTFDESQPTCSTGGKPKVMSILKEKFAYKHLVMIGDGATDMEAVPPADAFIGFGGNQIRSKVQEGAQWFVTDFKELINVLDASSDS
ncbi:phosphoserine phosphatase-like isoform X1 [Lytechinus variegatus]|uniref:phosphoserine phosphatase-like isoform X1 n=2 Tax=Lytechinus variegatus TaxID=7654 RepID=UPI001BB24623|nr:phosphoserine phosphatase-like isoform X1 [Lytechinus variegatus]